MSQTSSSPRSRVAYSFHWLTMSSRMSVHEVLQVLPDGQWGIVEQQGGYGNPRKITHASGLQVYFGSPREDQPVVIVATGETCERIDLAKVLPMGDRITRVDVAADIEVPGDGRKFIIDIRDACRSGAFTHPSKSTSVTLFEDDNPGQGNTVRIGSPTSLQFLRIYSRRGPIRFEFQYKPPRDTSDVIRDLIAQDRPGHLWRRQAFSYGWDHPVWDELTRGPMADLPRMIEKPADVTKYVNSLRRQHGCKIRFLKEAGYTMDDLSDDRSPSPRTVARLKLMTQSIPEGYNHVQARKFVDDLSRNVSHRRAGPG